MAKMIKVSSNGNGNGKKRETLPGGQTTYSRDSAKKKVRDAVASHKAALDKAYKEKGGDKPTWQDAYKAYLKSERVKRN